MSTSIAICEMEKSYKIQASTRFFSLRIKEPNSRLFLSRKGQCGQWIRVNLNSQIFFMQLDTDVRYEVISLWIPPTLSAAIKLFYSCRIDRYVKKKNVLNQPTTTKVLSTILIFLIDTVLSFSCFFRTPAKLPLLRGYNQVSSCRLPFYKLITEGFYIFSPLRDYLQVW